MSASSAAEQRASGALREALQEVRQTHALLDQYETTRDKRKLADVSLKMKELLPTIKELSLDPDCKTKTNAPLLVELSTGMKEAVARTKNFSAEAVAGRPPAAAPAPRLTDPPTPTAPRQQAISGWLSKLGDKGLIKSWKRRWFAQRAERLYYYEAKDETGLKGFVDLSLVTSVAESPKIKHGFELRTRDRIYYLQASSDDDRAHWMQALSSWLDGRTGSPQRPSPTNGTPEGSGRTSSDFGRNPLSYSGVYQQPNNEAAGDNGEQVLSSTPSRAQTTSMAPRRATEVSPARASGNYGAAPAAVETPVQPAVAAAPVAIDRAREPSVGSADAAPSSFREEEIRALQQKLLSLEAKLDSPSAKAVPARAPDSASDSPPTPSASSASSSSAPAQPSSSSSSSSPSSSSTSEPPSSSSTSSSTSSSRPRSPSLVAPASSRTSVASLLGAEPAPPTQSAPQVSQQNNAADEQLRALERKLAAAEEEAKRAVARLEHVKQKCNGLKLKLKTAEQRIEGLTEDVTVLTKESRAKEEHIASLKASNGPQSGSASQAATPREQLEETVAQLRQATHAHQTQNAYLASELKKLQRERAIEVAAKDEELEGLRTQLEQARQNTSGSPDNLQAEFTTLQRMYFSALAVGIKLNLMLQGQPCNIDAASLWDKVQLSNLHFSRWNAWVLSQYEEAFDD